MKKLPCSNPMCYTRRVHWTNPDKQRKTQLVEVHDEYEGKVYCSIECMMYAKSYEDISVTKHPHKS